MIKENQVARGVRVKFNENFEPTSLAAEHMMSEAVMYLDDKCFNDQKGQYVFVRGGSHTNSCTAYLTELDLEFPVTDTPLYTFSDLGNGCVNYKLEQYAEAKKQLEKVIPIKSKMTTESEFFEQLTGDSHPLISSAQTELWLRVCLSKINFLEEKLYELQESTKNAE